MRVLRHLGRQKRHGFRSVNLALHAGREPVPIAQVDGRAASQIGKAKGLRAIAAKIRPQKRKQSCVLGNRQCLAATERPPDGGEIEAENPDLAKKRRCHILLLI
jgi:hypothetical protein